MNWNAWIRQAHRWLSIVFTVAVAANFAILGMKGRPMWVVYAPLAPLFLLLFSGLYMFVSPHAARWRGAALRE